MKYVLSVFDPECRYITSPILPPRALAVIRLCFASYCLFVILLSLATDEEGLKFWFAYFTHLTYVGMCAYFFASGVQTARFAWSPQKRYALRSWPRFLQFAHEALWASIMSLPPLVSLIYWTLLNPPTTDFTAEFVTVSMHGFNSIFCLFEVFLTSTPVALWWYCIPCDAALALYCGLNYIFATKQILNTYVYSFLDPDVKGGATAFYIFGIAFGEVVMYGIMRYVVLLRVKIVERIQRRNRSDDEIPLTVTSSNGSRRWWGGRAKDDGESQRFIETDLIPFPGPSKASSFIDPYARRD